MFANSFFSLPSEVMTALGMLLGYALMGDLTADEQDSLGNFLLLIGQVLAMNASQKSLLESRQDDENMKAIQNRLKSIETRLTELEKP